MATPKKDTVFAGSIPQIYDRYLVPLIFEPYAADVAARVASRQPARVLETAAGTGVVTRRLASTLSRGTTIVATDLNQPMLDHAAAVGTAAAVEWKQADAMQLPFDDESFDVVVCQFGVMFLPDKAKAFAEARRVLRPGGLFVFNVWDRIEENELADTVTQALASLYPEDPPHFFVRIPHGYHDRATIAHDLAQGGFEQPPQIDTVTHRSRAEAPDVAAIALCQGTPLRNEIEARGASRLVEATEAATAAIVRRFGSGAVDARIQAHVIAVER